MKVMALGNDTKNVSYAIFDSEILCEYGKIENVENIKLYDTLNTMLEKHKMAFVVLKAIDFDKTKRRFALESIKTRAVVKLLCEKIGVIYTTPSTYGFDRFFFGDKIQDKKLELEKLKVTNELFDLQNDDVDLANAIMLGWSFAKNQYKVYKEGEYKLWV